MGLIAEVRDVCVARDVLTVLVTFIFVVCMMRSVMIYVMSLEVFMTVFLMLVKLF
jgi:hypothetical protein